MADTNAVENQELWKAQEVADRLTISVRTLWRMLQRGDFPQPIRYSRKLVRWKAGEVNAWLERQTRS